MLVPSVNAMFTVKGLKGQRCRCCFRFRFRIHCFLFPAVCFDLRGSVCHDLSRPCADPAKLIDICKTHGCKLFCRLFRPVAAPAIDQNDLIEAIFCYYNRYPFLSYDHLITFFTILKAAVLNPA